MSVCQGGKRDGPRRNYRLVERPRFYKATLIDNRRWNVRATIKVVRKPRFRPADQMHAHCNIAQMFVELSVPNVLVRTYRRIDRRCIACGEKL
jgi:hypothetical protein